MYAQSCSLSPSQAAKASVTQSVGTIWDLSELAPAAICWVINTSYIFRYQEHVCQSPVNNCQNVSRDLFNSVLTCPVPLLKALVSTGSNSLDESVSWNDARVVCRNGLLCILVRTTQAGEGQISEHHIFFNDSLGGCNRNEDESEFVRDNTESYPWGAVYSDASKLHSP